MKDERMHSRPGNGNILDLPIHLHKAEFKERVDRQLIKFNEQLRYKFHVLCRLIRAQS